MSEEKDKINPEEFTETELLKHRYREIGYLRKSWDTFKAATEAELESLKAKVDDINAWRATVRVQKNFASDMVKAVGWLAATGLSIFGLISLIKDLIK